MNPFIITGIASDGYFCDRIQETQKLIQAIENRSNILLTSPRRMGKTQLIRHVFAQDSIKDNYYTFYTDIYATTSLQELVIYLGKEIYTQLVPYGKRALDLFFSTLKSISGTISYDPIKCVPTFNLHLGDLVHPDFTLAEIFEYLEKADKPCVFAIDEFQKIGDYPQKNVEALLRTEIQKMSNCCFIFAGSNRHVLENMFNSPARPFYKSSGQMYLDRIDKSIYTDFIIQSFAQEGIKISDSAANLAYDLFEGHTFYVHYLMNYVYGNVSAMDTVSEECIIRLLEDVIEEQSHTFSSMMGQLSYQQKEVLIAISKSGKARGVTSVGFIKQYSLTSPSSVQNALRTLIDKDLVTYEVDLNGNKSYMVTDRYFAIWLNQIY